ncbi:MAG: methionyl-tRNA formyltransferase [Candidatus Paceibacterota bacterium]|jgi:methionyl-tRNA formyltransferase
MKSNSTPLRIAFFGTSEFSVIVLDALKRNNIVPTVIVTAPDKPQGRNLKLTPPPAKIWAEANAVPFIQPATLKTPEFKTAFAEFGCNLSIVAAYGLIIPKDIIELPKYKTLNIHPSLLPEFRGPSPLQSTLLADKRDTGITIMCIDELVDHGPIVAQKKVTLPVWPIDYDTFQKFMAEEGAQLLIDTLPAWIAGTIQTTVQDDNNATFTKKIKKEDGLISLSGDPHKNFLTIQAFSIWPGTYFFALRSGKRIRVIIKKARFENNELVIDRVIPEGKKEMDFQDFLRSATLEQY